MQQHDSLKGGAAKRHPLSPRDLNSTSNAWFSVERRVADATASQAPVVALETTVLTHGLPHPDGLNAATELEQDIRSAGATPATIGVLRGSIRVGLSRAELTELATTPDIAKVNLSNLAAVLTAGMAGSTTVAATVFAAQACGISVFATGGIGGVHREATEIGDVSSDLTALARFPVAVVCAGAKAILDLPRTVEMLETLGVPILGWQTGTFPAFYRRTSGLRVDGRFDSIERLAAAVRAHVALLGTGVLVVNPVPEEHEMDLDLYQRALDTALGEASSERVSGRTLTPFLLDRMRQLTGGASVRTNVALLRHNAQVAAQLAIAMCDAA